MHKKNTFVYFILIPAIIINYLALALPCCKVYSIIEEKYWIIYLEDYADDQLGYRQDNILSYQCEQTLKDRFPRAQAMCNLHCFKTKMKQALTLNLIGLVYIFAGSFVLKYVKEKNYQIAFRAIGMILLIPSYIAYIVAWGILLYRASKISDLYILQVTACHIFSMPILVCFDFVVSYYWAHGLKITLAKLSEAGNLILDLSIGSHSI